MKGYKKVVFTEGLVSRINDTLTEVDKIQSVIDKESFIKEVKTQGWFGKKKIHYVPWDKCEIHSFLKKHVVVGTIVYRCFFIQLSHFLNGCDIVYGIEKTSFYTKLKTLQTLSSNTSSDNEALIDDELYSVLLDVVNL